MIKALLIGTTIVITACSGKSSTQIHASVVFDDNFGLNALLVNANGETRSVDALHDLTISVPDSWAGKPMVFAVAGLIDTDKKSYGKVEVTPKLNDTVDVEMTLQPLQCAQPCAEGATRCEGNGVATCLVVDTCSVWSQPVDCDLSLPFCSDGKCAATCTDECTADALVCDGTGATKSCGQADSDTCLDWKDPIACPAAQTCSNGACRSTCTPTVKQILLNPSFDLEPRGINWGAQAEDSIGTFSNVNAPSPPSMAGFGFSNLISQSLSIPATTSRLLISGKHKTRSPRRGEDAFTMTIGDGNQVTQVLKLDGRDGDTNFIDFTFSSPELFAGRTIVLSMSTSQNFDDNIFYVDDMAVNVTVCE
jgi:hypothetical protein